MAPGAAIAFLTAGAVTSIPAAVAVFALVERPVFLWSLRSRSRARSPREPCIRRS